VQQQHHQPIEVTDSETSLCDSLIGIEVLEEARHTEVLPLQGLFRQAEEMVQLDAEVDEWVVLLLVLRHERSRVADLDSAK